MQTFEIVFQGQVRQGISIEQARTRLGQLFQAGDKQLDVLFSGRRVVIKQGLDAASAERYREAIERAGALCLVEPMGEPEPVAGGAAMVTRPASAAFGSDVRPRDAYMAAFADVEAPDLEIAPLGTDLQDEYADFVPLPLDLSALSLAPAGADLEQLRPERPTRTPSTEHLQD